MRKTLIVAVLAAAVAAPLAAQNQPAAPQAPAQAQQPQVGNTPEDRARGGVIFRTFSVVMNSDKVEQSVKNRLASCLYNTPMRNLSVATANVFAKNAGLDPKNPRHIYAVASQLCGVKPAQSAQQPTPTPAPTQSAQAPSR